MIFKTRLILACSVLVLISGCISTSSGTPPPELDKDESARRFYQLGAQYYRNGSFDLAKDRLQTALEYEPKMAVAHSALALTYVQLENSRLAREHFELAVRYGPDNFDARNAYAVFLCQQKDFVEAKKQFDRAIAVYDNDNAEVMLTNAGVCMANKPDYVLAEEYYREALEFKSSYGEALIQLASLKHRTGNDLHARAFMQRYLISNPVSPSVLYLGIQIEKNLGDNRASTDYSNQLLREFPNSAEAKFVLDNR